MAVMSDIAVITIICKIPARPSLMPIYCPDNLSRLTGSPERVTQPLVVVIYCSLELTGAIWTPSCLLAAMDSVC